MGRSVIGLQSNSVTAHEISNNNDEDNRLKYLGESISSGKRDANSIKQINPLLVKVKPVKIKYSTLKKKAKIIKAKKAFRVTKAQGKVTYKMFSGSKKIAISKTGNVTVKKKLKKGTYKVKVKVTAAGNKKYKAGSKTVTLKVKVK